MPAVNQGSRGGLIAWTVVTSILGVTCMVLSIYFYVDSKRVEDSTKTKLDQVGDVITSAMMAGESDKIEELKAARTDEKRGLNNPSMKLFDVALWQRDQLAKLIGSESEPTAVNAARAALEKAKAAAGGSPESLVAAVNALVTKVEALQTEVKNSKADSEESRNKLTQTLNDTKSQIDQLNKAMDALRAEKDATIGQTAQLSSSQQTAFNQTAEDMRKQLETSQEQINQLNSQLASEGQEKIKLQAQIKALQDRLGINRIDTAGMMTRQADGKIVSIARSGSKTVTIDLGANDHISPGLTFEVYDRYDGIPPAGDPSTDAGLPIGKASIEVIHVGAFGSECQVNRLTLGQTLTEGDLVANLVYDRNQKFNFVVYGDFDMDGNGIATAADAEKIKSLVTNWGGTIVSEINVNTDFVVLGKEPVIPDKPSPDDALAVDNYNKAMAALDEYQTISSKARDFRLPILNQNRFLVLCGYWSLARR